MASINNNNNNTFAQPDFKQELIQKAEETMQTESYQADAHKAVAMDAAVMAASKSDEFAKIAAAGFPAPADNEGYIEIAKEKLGDTVEVARENLASATNYVASTIDLVSGVLVNAKDRIGESIGGTVDMIADKLPLTGNSDVTGTTPDNTGKPLAGYAFKQELAKTAEEMMEAESYQQESHKAVAMDAAVMAASKSGEFAKIAAAGFPITNQQDEGYLELAKEKLSDTMEVVREKLGEGLGYIAEKMSPTELMSAEDTARESLSNTNFSTKPLAQTEFKQELATKAEEKMESASYQWEEHKLVAKDAAVLAASKSGEFAKVAAAGFPTTNMEEEHGILDAARETLASAQETVSNTAASVQATTGQAYKSTVNTIGGAVEVAKETLGGGLEFIAEKMQSVGDTLISGAAETKEKGVQMQREAELNEARFNLQSPLAI